MRRTLRLIAQVIMSDQGQEGKYDKSM
jgi:hypothetical protein